MNYQNQWHYLTAIYNSSPLASWDSKVSIACTFQHLFGVEWAIRVLFFECEHTTLFKCCFSLFSNRVSREACNFRSRDALCYWITKSSTQFIQWVQPIKSSFTFHTKMVLVQKCITLLVFAQFCGRYSIIYIGIWMILGQKKNPFNLLVTRTNQQKNVIGLKVASAVYWVVLEKQERKKNISVA